MLHSLFARVPHRGMVQVMAAYDYVAAKPADISMKKGDIIRLLPSTLRRFNTLHFHSSQHTLCSVTEKKPSGWWSGSIISGSVVGASGLFPGNYVQVRLCFDRRPRLTRPLVQPLKKVRAKFAYQARKADELTYNKGDIINVRKPGQNWWYERDGDAFSGL